MLEQGHDGVRTLCILNVQTWHNKLHLQTGDLTQYNYLPPPPPQMMNTLVLNSWSLKVVLIMCLLLPELVGSLQVRGQDFKSCPVQKKRRKKVEQKHQVVSSINMIEKQLLADTHRWL